MCACVILCGQSNLSEVMLDETKPNMPALKIKRPKTFVVNREFPELFKDMVHLYSDRTDVRVLLDRRHGERQMTTAIVQGCF